MGPCMTSEGLLGQKRDISRSQGKDRGSDGGDQSTTKLDVVSDVSHLCSHLRVRPVTSVRKSSGTDAGSKTREGKKTTTSSSTVQID